MKEKIMGKYFVYNTLWTEGDVVAHSSDIGFAIGYSPYDGIRYVKSLDELLATHSFNLISVHDKESETFGMNTSLYPRRESPYCQICNRVIPDDVAHCNISDCPHLNKLDDETN